MRRAIRTRRYQQDEPSRGQRAYPVGMTGNQLRRYHGPLSISQLRLMNWLSLVDRTISGLSCEPEPVESQAARRGRMYDAVIRLGDAQCGDLLRG